MTPPSTGPSRRSMARSASMPGRFRTGSIGTWSAGRHESSSIGVAERARSRRAIDQLTPGVLGSIAVERDELRGNRAEIGGSPVVPHGGAGARLVGVRRAAPCLDVVEVDGAKIDAVARLA